MNALAAFVLRWGALAVLAAALFGGTGCSNGESVAAPGAIPATSDGSSAEAESEASVSDASVCASFCALGEQVACPTPARDCRARCETGLAGPCATASRVLVTCVVSQTVTDFTCDSRGKWMLRGDLCAAEQTAVVRCLSGSGS